MTTVAVVAHSGKTFGGGLGELREVLSREGIDPLWFEVPKSRRAPKAVRAALAEGADLLLAWGGDGLQQRCIEVLAGTGVPLGILPAGTGNLLAHNLDVPSTVGESVMCALRGDDRRIDTALMNGERFAVMAGAGFDAVMLREADAGLKDRLGRAAYLWTGLRAVGESRVRAKVKVDGEVQWDGPLSCVLIGNVPQVFGAVEAFEGARPDDGLLEVGLVSADTPLQWTRTVARVVVDRADRSPYVHVVRGRKVRVRLSSKLDYELDGGARGRTKRISVDVEPASLVVRVPARVADAAVDLTSAAVPG